MKTVIIVKGTINVFLYLTLSTDTTIIPNHRADIALFKFLFTPLYNHIDCLYQLKIAILRKKTNDYV